MVVQTNQDFTVYIGDDASPQDLKNIVSLYQGKLDIVYHRFETNLGKKDLPGHWERCIEMSKEPVIWFFSDDDLMPCDGIERVLKALQECGEKNIMFRFPLVVVDGENNEMYANPSLQTKRFLDITFYWINWKVESVLQLVNMCSAVMFIRRELALSSFLWLGARMMQRGRSLQIVQKELLLCLENPFAGEM